MQEELLLGCFDTAGERLDTFQIQAQSEMIYRRNKNQNLGSLNMVIQVLYHL
jgi:hypothetical protein